MRGDSLAQARAAFAEGDFRTAAKQALAAGRVTDGHESTEAFRLAAEALVVLGRFDDAETIYRIALRDTSYPESAALEEGLERARARIIQSPQAEMTPVAHAAPAPSPVPDSRSRRRITPLDIHRKEFARTLRGYDEEQVDSFLDEVADEMERLFRQSIELAEQVDALKAKVGMLEAQASAPPSDSKTPRPVAGGGESKSPKS